MADVIFQERTCLKHELYQTIIGLMVGAGWRNISSDPVTDFAVMHSTGESEDKNLVFQLRPTNVTNASDTVTTDQNVMSIRLIAGYTPGTPAEGQSTAAGTAKRPSEAWRAFYTSPTTTAINREVELKLSYHVNKDRLILIIETPESLNFAPITHYIGLPEVFSSEPNSRGLIWATSSYAVAANNVLITDAVGELPEAAASSNRATYITLPPSSPNSAGRHTPVMAFYGNATEGWRGKIDGLYFLPAGAISTGDTLTVGTKTFRGVVNGVASNNSFITSTLLYQIN